MIFRILTSDQISFKVNNSSFVASKIGEVIYRDYFEDRIACAELQIKDKEFMSRYCLKFNRTKLIGTLL